MKQLNIPNEYRIKISSFIATHQELFVQGRERELAEAFRESILPLEDLTALMSEQLRKHEEQIAWNKQEALRRYTILLEPLPNDQQYEIVGKGPNSETYRRKIARQATTVYMRDLDSFCRERKLNRDEIMKVALGEIPEHRGYARANMFCDPANRMCAGHRYVKSEPPTEKKTTLNPDAHPIVQTVDPGWQKPPVTFVPDPEESKPSVVGQLMNKFFSGSSQSSD